MTIPIVRGVSFLPYVIQMQDANSDPIDLTGCTAYATAVRPNSGTVVFSFDAEITDEANGEITFNEMSPLETKAIAEGIWKFDLVIETAAGRRTQYLAGSIANVTSAATIPPDA
jgi:hypothetical protein